MDRQRLAVANMIARKLDYLDGIADAMKQIGEARAENISVSFNIFCQTDKGQISVSSSSLSEFELNLSDLINTIVSSVNSEVSKKHEDLLSAFENDQFGEKG